MVRAQAMATTAYRLFDREGLPIGLVVDPRSLPIVGPGAGTILLIRREEKATAA